MRHELPYSIDFLSYFDIVLGVSREIMKYNPKNIIPENLFRPPTSRTHSELAYLVKQVNQDLEGSGKDRRLLLVGTELEIYFFSPELDPVEAKSRYGNSGDNPNYGKTHLRKIQKVAGFAKMVRYTKPGEFIAPERIGRIMVEFRTAPQRAMEYLVTMEKFGNLLRKKCKDLGILPTVYSQHIHLSLRGNDELRDLFGDSDSNGIVPDGDVTSDAFSRIGPLVLLPEEWSGLLKRPEYINRDGKRSIFSNNLHHPEFRMLSSEYANDPLLNLLVSLRAMYAGCLDESMVSARSLHSTYEDDVVEMGHDHELERFFGRSTLTSLAGIVEQYPAVSRREKTINQVC
ncbi:hypothetical protein HYU90_02115 [Candidatus Collierbacteria bacterium]|nr:hypothetical protein [Candidatus Collierbacteria bacterium]